MIGILMVRHERRAIGQLAKGRYREALHRNLAPHQWPPVARSGHWARSVHRTVVADRPWEKAAQGRRQGSCAMAATSRSSWSRWRCKRLVRRDPASDRSAPSWVAATRAAQRRCVHDQGGPAQTRPEGRPERWFGCAPGGAQTRPASGESGVRDNLSTVFDLK